jgi:2-aminoadipate transaminase
MPAVDNPRGVSLPAPARQALLAGRVPVIEDDAYADLLFAGPAPRPLLAEAPGQVLHVGTFSKTLCPGLRIGWLVVPPRLRRRALNLKEGSDLQAGSLAQAIVEDYLTGGGDGPGVDFEGRLVRLRRFYRARAAKLARAVRAHLPEWRFQPPAGGFSIWLEAPASADEVSELALLDAATAEGVTFDPGSLFRPDRAPGPLALRLCFSAAAPDSFEEGARRLARAWRRVSRVRPGARGGRPRDGRNALRNVHAPGRRWATASPQNASVDSR